MNKRHISDGPNRFHSDFKIIAALGCANLCSTNRPRHETPDRTIRGTNWRRPNVHFFSISLANFTERKLNPKLFFSNFSGTAGISQQNPGISRQKSLISLVSRGIPNFLAPTPSCGRPLPHWKISGLKSLGLGSFFVPEI